jgi:predicted transcriptional regulator
MESHTVRITKSTHDVLRQLADKAESTMTAVLEAAVKEYQEKRFWEEYYAGYAALKADPKKWAEYQEDIGAWDVTLADGLEGY